MAMRSWYRNAGNKASVISGNINRRRKSALVAASAIKKRQWRNGEKYGGNNGANGAYPGWRKRMAKHRKRRKIGVSVIGVAALARQTRVRCSGNSINRQAWRRGANGGVSQRKA
jgi:hypothetical protein